MSAMGVAHRTRIAHRPKQKKSKSGHIEIMAAFLL
jgi:hypothetical protein